MVYGSIVPNFTQLHSLLKTRSSKDILLLYISRVPITVSVHMFAIRIYGHTSLKVANLNLRLKMTKSEEKIVGTRPSFQKCGKKMQLQFLF